MDDPSLSTEELSTKLDRAIAEAASAKVAVDLASLKLVALEKKLHGIENWSKLILVVLLAFFAAVLATAALLATASRELAK